MFKVVRMFGKMAYKKFRKVNLTSVTSKLGIKAITANSSKFKGAIASILGGKSSSALMAGSKALATYIGIDYISKVLFGSSEIPNSEEAQAAVGLLENTKHVELAENYKLAAVSNSWAASFTYTANDLIQRIMWSKASITGNELDTSVTKAGSALSHRERAFLISRLVSTVKELAACSNHPSFYFLLGRQMMCSSMINSSFTNAFESLVRNRAMDSDMAKSACDAQNAIYESLYEELRDSAADDLFNAGTSSLDLFDLFGSREDYTGNAAANAEVRLNFLLACLASDDTCASQVGWFDKMRVDKNGKDDESAAVDDLIHSSAISEDYLGATVHIMRDNDGRAESILAND